MQVYAILAGNDAVKIGISTDATRRVSKVQSDNHLPCRIIGVREGGADIEAAIHLHLRDFRLTGEWFRWCAEAEAALARWGFAPVARLSRLGGYRPWAAETVARVTEKRRALWADPVWAERARANMKLGKARRRAAHAAKHAGAAQA